MKCVVLVAHKMVAVPIAECGGVTLSNGDKLIVKEEIADRMLLQYRGKLAWAETVKRENLRYGHYELYKSGDSMPAPEEVKEDPKEEIKEPLVSSDPIAVEAPVPEVKKISTDKNMGGKGGKKVHQRRK